MRGNKEEVNILMAEIENDLLAIRNLEGKIDELYQTLNQENILDRDKAAFGYYLHNLYNAVESILKRLTIFFENSIQGNSWHIDLLKRMTFEIPEVRPAVITQETYSRLNELRKFRHIFRHSYDYELRFKRMDELWKEYIENKDNFLRDIEKIKELLKIL